MIDRDAHIPPVRFGVCLGRRGMRNWEFACIQHLVDQASGTPVLLGPKDSRKRRVREPGDGHGLRQWIERTYHKRFFRIRALDPVPLESKLVIDATGHDASVVKKLQQRGFIEMAGEGALWIDKSEDAIVEQTQEVYPGLIVMGMAVGAVYGVPRMGPTFGAMFLSGNRAAEIALDLLGK